MRRLRVLRLSLRSLFRRDRLEDQLSAELAFHIAEQTAELVAQGMPEREAALAARKLFGAPALVAEQCRDARRTRWLEDLLVDLRYAARRLMASPGFTLTAMGILALGAGANLAFFSAAWAVMIQPLPYPGQDQLLQVETGIAGVGPVLGLRQYSAVVDYAGYDPGADVIVRVRGEAVRLSAAESTANLAAILRISPALGRWFD